MEEDRFEPLGLLDQAPYAGLAAGLLAIVWTLAALAVEALPVEGWQAHVAEVAAFLLLGWPLLSLGVGVPYLRNQNAQSRENHEREVRLRADARRQDFESRLHRALEMADDEVAALAVVAHAFAGLSDEPTELLLADSSQAHLHPSAVHPEAGGPGCTVPSPGRCTAVRRGQTVQFRSGEDLDACPYLRDRPTGDRCAACVPVTVLGLSVGVLHVTDEPGSAVPDRVVTALEAVANQAGARVGMIRALARSEVQASTDPLTGMLNRRSLEDAMRPVIESGGDYAVVMADLDHFKDVNDTYGHDAGDRALRQFSEAVRRTLRPGDLASRHGGEEFVFVLPGCGTAEAVTAAERLREAIALANINGDNPGFTASFGVADSRTSGSDLTTLVIAADQALRQAKQAGRDRVVTAPVHV